MALLGCDSGAENTPDGNGFDLPSDSVFTNLELGSYTLSFSTSATIFTGTVTAYQPDGGYVSLGPERVQNGDEPIASLAITIPASCFTNEAIVNDACNTATFSFYTIGNPGAPIGAQEAYSYEKSGDGLVRSIQTGTNSRGVLFIKGVVMVEMSRLPPAIGDFEPETIQLQAVFTAKQAGA